MRYLLKILRSKLFISASQAVIGIVFIFASLDKIANPGDFAVAIVNYKIIPLSLVNIFAIVIPWLELFCGILILFGEYIKESSFIISSLLLVFVVMIAAAVFRNLDIDCGCFGTLDAQKVGLTKIVENVVLLLLSVNIFYAPFTKVRK
ncbi:MAG: DoxX family membrane protein [Bacteroidetes bacterium]|nr:DoxX family membrane protein [Bacteroidota bacterium]MBU1677447.1 DoxX family membrane protein [Bacteroidota bacterium]